MPEEAPKLPVGAPPASGARFRCTCCQQEVYESQLEYHASFCLPVLASIAERESQGSEVSQSPSPSYTAQIDLAQEILLGKEKKRWRWEESDLQIHHAQAEERTARKRQELLEEMKRKEEEQCTFTPRLISRRSKSCGRMSETRKSKLESVESEMYRENTHQPVITPRARSLAKEREGDAMNVFDRLYHRAQHERKPLKEVEVSSRRRPRSQEARSRSLDACHSLYFQGMEQRARQEQVQPAPQQTHQVSGRSREYYWQMLDRQIRDAFDKAASGSQLAYSELEGFLWHFGVTQREVPSGRSQEDSRRLRAALWRHLDPDEVGYVDFLTLQVFFWVLMVAVADESQEAQKLHNLARQAEEESERRSEAAHSVQNAKLAAATVSPEGSRICELLMRFNPKQLRHEFRQLYLDRLHHGKVSSELDEAPSVHSLSCRSRRLAERVHQKMQEEAGTSSHVELLLWRRSQAEAERQRRREEKAVQEADECTFRPCLVSRRPAAPLHCGQRLYEQATQRRQSREENAAAQERSRLDKEMAACTFRPNLKKSGRSFNASFKPSPRGADASAQRLRKAFQEKDCRRRYLEERAPSPAAERGEEELRARSMWLASPGSRSWTSTLSSPRPSPARPRAQPKQRPTDSRKAKAPKGPTASPRTKEGESRPLLVAEISISQDRQPEQIVLYPGEDVTEVAAGFARKHRLEPHLAERLKRYLSDLTST